jgi:hypothetical protein
VSQIVYSHRGGIDAANAVSRIPRAEYLAGSLSRSKPWKAQGISRAKWYRLGKLDAAETSPSSAETGMSAAETGMSPTDELVLVSGVPPIRAKKARY